MYFSFYRSQSREKAEYNPLSKDDYACSCSSDETMYEKMLEPEPVSDESRRSCTRRPVSVRTAVIISITIAVLLTVALVPISRLILARYEKQIPLTCGSSVEEAQAKGCVFDLLDYSWVPSECYDAETADEFAEWLSQPKLHHGAFPFFEDHHMKKKVANAEALSKRVGMKTYAPQQEHEAHCVFSARRHFRAAEHPELRRVRKSLMHNLHCLNELEESLTTDSSRWKSEFGVGFATC